MQTLADQQSTAPGTFALIRKRSPLPNTFRAWHVGLSIVAVSVVLTMVLWKAFQIHDIAVGIQQDRLSQITIRTIREPVARLLKQIETVGSHARTIAQTYQTFGGRRPPSSTSQQQQGSTHPIVCEAPPANTCAPSLERYLSSVGAYAEALYFVRYVYVSVATYDSFYSNYTTSTATSTQPPTTIITDVVNNGSDSSGNITTVAPSTPPSKPKPFNETIHCPDVSSMIDLSPVPPTTIISSGDAPSSSSTTMSTTTSSTTTTTSSSTTSTTANATNESVQQTEMNSTSSTSAVVTTTHPSSSSSSSSSSSTIIMPSDRTTPVFWHECGCDIIEGCYYVDDTKRRHVFGIQRGLNVRSDDAQDLNGLDYVEWIKNLTVANSAGEWSEPREYREIYENSFFDTGVELLLQFSVPLAFDENGRCSGAASIDISTEFIASVLSVDENNATFFFLDRRGPTLLGESSANLNNRVVRRKFNPLAVSLPEEYASDNVLRLMPLFRSWIGGSTEKYLPLNETSTHSAGYALAATPVGKHWVLFQAVGVSDLAVDEYRFMRHGRLYLPVIVGASVMLALMLIEFVHGTFPSAEWRYDDDEEEQRRKRLNQQRALRRQRASRATSHRAFEMTIPEEGADVEMSNM